MKNILIKLSAVAGLAFAAALPAAHASDVYWSVGISGPGVVTQVGTLPPAPVYYPAPAYYPAPVYVAPQPVYYPPAVVYRPAPVYVAAPPVAYYPRWQRERRWEREQRRAWAYRGHDEHDD